MATRGRLSWIKCLTVPGTPRPVPSSRRMSLELREVIRDFEPGRLRSHEDVLVGPNRGCVDHGSQGDMNIGAAADDRIEQRTAGRAVSVMGVGLADDQQLVAPLDQLHFRPLDTGEGLERRAGGAATVRAVAIHGVPELVGHRVADGTTIARARESAGGGVLRIGHWLVALISLVAPCKIPLSLSMGQCSIDLRQLLGCRHRNDLTSDSAGPTKSGGAAIESAYLGFGDTLAPQFRVCFVTARDPHADMAKRTYPDTATAKERAWPNHYQ
jgi:hypothetical protein